MILEVKKITKRFGGISALNNCSLSCEKGKVTAIIGPNGSGKTTLFNVITRLLEPDQGSIMLNGKQVTKKRDFQVSRGEISRTFQEARLFEYLSIRQHLQLALSKSESLFTSFFRNEKDDEQVLLDALDQVGLAKPLDTYATDLSYGQRKLLDLAIALLKPHTLLLLDEPVAGVNPALRKSIKQVITSLKRKGESVVIIEHDMNFVMDLADTVHVMDAGSLIVSGTPSEVQNNKKVLEAYLGE